MLEYRSVSDPGEFAARKLPDDAVGRRIGASLIDFVVLFLLIFPFGLLSGDTSTEGGGLFVNLEGASTAGFLGVCVLYFVVLEALTGGSIGKLLVGLRVTTEDGKRPALWQIFVRNVLRAVDVLPIAYILGFIMMLASGPEHRQRIGDRLARTLVVPRASKPQ